MTITREFLEGVREEARPLIRQSIELSGHLADIRTKVADEGGDWSALKALLKAEILDEEGGDHIKKLVGRLDESTQYAAMLGLGGVNKKSFSDPAPVTTSPPDTKTGEAGADAESQDESPSPVGASATNSVSLEAAASETAARSPNLSKGEGRKRDTQASAPSGDSDGGDSGTVAALDISESEPVRLEAPIRSGRADADRKTAFPAGSPPINAASMAFLGGDLEAAPIAASSFDPNDQSDIRNVPFCRV